LPNIIASGTQPVDTHGKEFGVEHVNHNVPKKAQVLLTARTATNTGPHYCPFWRPNNSGFDIIVYDIMAHGHPQVVQVDWAIVSP
jgi:hypothetical protein